MTEAHCHISFNDLASMEQAVNTQPEDHALNSLANAQMLLQRGFTSLFSAASAKPRLDVAVRDLDTNYLTLPRNIRFAVTCDGAEEFTKAARLAARDGVDSIKVNVSGDRDWGHMHAEEEARDMLEAARERVFVAPPVDLFP